MHAQLAFKLKIGLAYFAVTLSLPQQQKNQSKQINNCKINRISTYRAQVESPTVFSTPWWCWLEKCPLFWVHTPAVVCTMCYDKEACMLYIYFRIFPATELMFWLIFSWYAWLVSLNGHSTCLPAHSPHWICMQMGLALLIHGRRLWLANQWMDDRV